MISSSIESEFDFIIVGAGSAGCVLANRLTTSGRYKVLLLEAGPKDTNPWIHVPLGYGKLFADPAINWLYKSEPQAHLNNRQIVQPRGKVLGGSSSINGLVYIRGQHEDFDQWRSLGNTGWGWDDVAPYFLRSENQMRGASRYHGVDGPLAISDHTEPHPLCEAFIGAAEADGCPRNDDFNGAIQEGVGYYQTTSFRGRRCSAAVAYLRPAKHRPNLRIETHARVLRVDLNGRCVVGVTWSHAGAEKRARARCEVILSAGAIGSPQLLQLSGIGPAELLRRHGIEPRCDSPGVGANLQDHLQVRCVYRCNRRITFNDDFANPLRMLGVAWRYLISGRGPLTVSAGYAGAFVRSRSEMTRPDVQLYFINYSTNRMGESLHRFSGFTVSCCQLRPESRGSVRIKSSDPFAAPAIDPNYLSTSADMKANLEGIKLIRRILGRSPINAYIKEEYSPGPTVIGDGALLDYARNTAGSLYHPTCTARMGNDDCSVVDERLRVRGIGALRIVDGAVMPILLSGNTHAGVVMIAEKGADMILQDVERTVSATFRASQPNSGT